MRTRRSAWAAIMTCAVTTSCNQGPKACLQPRQCAEGYECLASRCMPLGADPVPRNSERLVLRPNRLGILGRGVHRGQKTVKLHDLDGRELELLMDFDLSEAQSPATAFLILSAVELPPSNPTPTEVRVARVIDSWSDSTLQQGATPQTDFEHASGLLGESQSSRIDVTRLVRAAVREPERSFGFVITSPEPSQVVIALDGPRRSPLLELYTQPKGKGH